MALIQAPGDTRGSRRTLRAERAQLLRWRRVLRARLDLAVAAFAPPEPLGHMSWDLVPAAQLALPMHRELVEAVKLPQVEDQVELMQRLRVLDRALAIYGAELDDALEDSTQLVLDQLASLSADRPDPAAPPR